MKKFLLRVHWILNAQLGLNPIQFLRSVLAFPHYVRDYFVFRRNYHGKMSMLPCLHDKNEEGGTTNSEYFWQDLLVSRMIFDNAPIRHADVGSRVDGFVAHVASYRDIEVFDVRPITTRIPGVTFKQADLMKGVNDHDSNCYDSISCLHALEHFGLGRYGDPIDAQGFDRGLANLSALLKNEGTLYLSVPIGEARVEFNGHRISDPRHVVKISEDSGLELRSLILVTGRGEVETVDTTTTVLDDIAQKSYLLGIFTFVKVRPG